MEAYSLYLPFWCRFHPRLAVKRTAAHRLFVIWRGIRETKWPGNFWGKIWDELGKKAVSNGWFCVMVEPNITQRSRDNNDPMGNSVLGHYAGFGPRVCARDSLGLVSAALSLTKTFRAAPRWPRAGRGCGMLAPHTAHRGQVPERSCVQSVYCDCVGRRPSSTGICTSSPLRSTVRLTVSPGLARSSR